MTQKSIKRSDPLLPGVRLINREVAHYVLLSRNVNMQRIALTFMLREIFDLAHYDTSTEDFARVEAKGI